MHTRKSNPVTVITADTSFELLADESLLEGLERTGHEVEYQCRGGYCGSCRVKLLAGSVIYVQMPLAFIGADEILPCCCIPLENIKVDCTRATDVQPPQTDLFVPDLFAHDDAQ